MGDKQFDPSDMTIEDMEMVMGSMPEIETHAISEYVEKMRREFVDYIIGESDVHVSAETFNSDAVLDALKELHHNGYQIDPEKNDSPDPIGYLHPKEYHNLLDYISAHSNIVAEVGGVDTLEVAGCMCHISPELPEGHAIILHPDATIPNHPRATERPWLVRDPQGVVVVTTRTTNP